MVIIGGGIGGLTLALALRANGITAEIHEQAPQLSEVGAAVALSANGTRVLHNLGLADGLARCSAVPTELIYRHWHDAHRIAAYPVGPGYEQLFGAPYYGVHRADLQKLLIDAVGAEQIHLDHRLTGLEDTGPDVRLEFADGNSARADLVIGADGVHSTVRDHIVDTETGVYSGTSGFRGLVPVEQLDLLPDPGAIQFWMGPGGHVLHYPIGDGSVVNFLAVVEGPRDWTAPGWVLPTTLEEITAEFAGWHPAMRQMVEATTLHQRWALFGQSPLNRWHRGRTVLLGDAAHAMLPHHGQGAN
ncbi:FAD-dependent monooxygenase, partial [Saccharopolyspora sp. NPDC002686]|uniref:FAD-dependent monooxygenase n=1 Tax=Saccharopolyspora sp. NPDC002686 TaxID=3154541 RepID=UPI00332A2D9A